MTKKIAVLVNEDTMQRCSCGGCLKAFMNKADSFERYADEDIELVGFTHSGGDLAKKIESFKKKGVTTVHLSTCTRGKNENYESIAEQCAEAGFDVVGYTHGGAVSKDGKEAVILSAKPAPSDEQFATFSSLVIDESAVLRVLVVIDQLFRTITLLFIAY